MNTIGLYNSLGTTSTGLANNNDAQVANAKKVAEAQDVSKDKSTKAGAGESLNLSSRAQKLQAISAEFFSHGNFTQVDTKKLIEKVHEYGLISDKEYQSLGANPLFKEDEETTDSKKVTSLVDHLTDVKKALDKTDTPENKELSLGISKAITILSDVEKSKLSPTFKQDINSAMLQLEKLSESDSYSKLDKPYQDAIEGSIAALDVIDKISPKRLSNPFINRYLDFSR